MMSAPKITFIGAGSTIFVKNILGDVFHREALKTATRYGVPLYFRYTGSKIVTSFSSFGSQIETKCN